MHKTTLLAVLGLSVTLVAPSVVAVHGEAYDAYGTAVAPSGTVLLAHVGWTGYNWVGGDVCSFGCFVIDLTDPNTNQVVSHEKFPGQWNANGPVIYFFEILNYQAWATDSGCTLTGCTHFFIRGFQGQQVTGGAPQKAIMFYQGNFWDYQLTLVVPYGVVL